MKFWGGEECSELKEQQMKSLGQRSWNPREDQYIAFCKEAKHGTETQAKSRKGSSECQNNPCNQISLFELFTGLIIIFPK